MHKNIDKSSSNFLVFAFCFISVLYLSLVSCKSPEEPEVHTFRFNVEVTYTRNTSKITNPSAKEARVILDYELYNPERSPTINKNFMDTNQISENVFRAYLSKVFVQTEKRSTKHIIWIKDPMLKQFDNTGMEIPTSSFTAENITISGAFDLQVSGYQLHFKMQ